MKIEDYYRMFVDAWRMFKHYYRQPGDPDLEDDEFWKAIVNDQEKFCRRYPESRLPVEIGLAVLTEIERISRNYDKENE